MAKFLSFIVGKLDPQDGIKLRLHSVACACRHRPETDRNELVEDRFREVGGIRLVVATPHALREEQVHDLALTEYLLGGGHAKN